MTGKELVPLSGEIVATPSSMPALSMAQASERYVRMHEFVENIMDEGVDYGQIPGTQKKTLFKAGAEKLSTFFGLVATFQMETEVEVWDDKPFFYYKVKCQLYRDNVLVGEGVGSCNSRESRYAYRWVPQHALHLYGINSEDKVRLHQRGGKLEEFKFAVEARETTGQYGKPDSYWDAWEAAIEDGRAEEISKKSRKGAEYPGYRMDGITYRVNNPDIYDLVNTVLKMAQKRALVAAVLVTCNASDYFTQDLEDFDLTSPAAATTDGNGGTKPSRTTRKTAQNAGADPGNLSDKKGSAGKELVEKVVKRCVEVVEGVDRPNQAFPYIRNSEGVAINAIKDLSEVQAYGLLTRWSDTQEVPDPEPDPEPPEEEAVEGTVVEDDEEDDEEETPTKVVEEEDIPF